VVVLMTIVMGMGMLGSIAAVHLGQREERRRLAISAPSPTEDPGIPANPPPDPSAPPAEPPPVSPPATGAAPVPTGPLKVVFLGDSVAFTTAAAVAPLSGTYGFTVDNRGILGCGVVRTVPFRYFGKHYDNVPNGCETWPETWRSDVELDQPDVAVVLVGRWELMDRVINGRWQSIGSPEFDADVAASLDTAVSIAAATGGRVVLATTPYYRRGLRPDGGTWPEDDPTRVDRFNVLLREAAARHPGVAVIELGAQLSVDGHLAMQIGGRRVRTDGVHVAPEAGSLLAPWLLPQLRALAAR
jgi:hypothetical protein